MQDHGFNSAARAGNGRLHHQDASIGALFKEISTEASHLVKQEVALARIELAESVGALKESGVKIGIAVALALPAVLALTAALVIGLGDLFDNYALGALVVGLVFAAVAFVMAKKAAPRELAPTHTLRTLRDDAQWAAAESAAVKQNLTAPYNRQETGNGRS